MTDDDERSSLEMPYTDTKFKAGRKKNIRRNTIDDYITVDESECMRIAAEKIGFKGSDAFYLFAKKISKKRLIIDKATHSLFYVLYVGELDSMRESKILYNTVKKKRKSIPIDPKYAEEDFEVIICDGRDKKIPQEISRIGMIDFTRIMARIFKSNWNEKIDSLNAVPSAIIYVITKNFISLKSVFVNMKARSYYFENEVCSDLMGELEESIQHIVDTYSLRIFENMIELKEDKNLDDDTQSWHDDVASETSISDRFDESEVKSIQNGNFLFLQEPASIRFDILPMREPCKRPSGRMRVRLNAHPYTISAAVFSTCNYAIYRITSEERKAGKGVLSDDRVYSNTTDFNWRDAKKLYLLCYDWLNDQVRTMTIIIPAEIKCMLNAILFYITGLDVDHMDQNRRLCQSYMKCFGFYINLFENISGVIKRFHISTKYREKKGIYDHVMQKTTSIFKNKSHLVKYEMIDESVWNSNVLSKLHPFYNTSDDRVPSIAFMKDTLSKTYLRFPSTMVTPLQLYYSMKRLEMHLNHSQSMWCIFYDPDHVYLKIDSNWFTGNISTYIPYMLYSETYLSRKVPYPTYPFHLINYFNGGRQGLLQTMKFIVRTFCPTRKITDTVNYMPDDANDICVDGYMVFHHLMTRFGSQKEIWNMLIEPLTSYQSLMLNSKYGGMRLPTIKETRYSKKGNELVKKSFVLDIAKLKEGIRDGSIQKPDTYSADRDRFNGIKNGTFTLYGAIRAFAYVKAQHFIHTNAIQFLYKLFTMEDPMLQIKYPLVFALVVMIKDQKKAEFSEELRIPRGGEYAVEEEHDDEVFYDPCAEVKKFPLPYQFILYYFCLSPDISDSDSIFIFMSITSKTKGKTLTSSLPFSFLNGERIERMKPYIDMYKKEASSHKCETIGSNDKEFAYANSMESLLQALEELSMHKMDVRVGDMDDKDQDYRGMVKEPEIVLPLNSREILSDSNLTWDSVIIDTEVDKSGNVKHFKLFDSLPIFDPEILQDSLDIKSKDISKYMIGSHLPPFFRSEDILECIIMYPICHVQCVSTEGCSLDISTITDISQTSHSCPIDCRVCIKPDAMSRQTSDGKISRKFSKESMDKNLATAQKKMRSILDDRKGWNGTHPSLQDILSQVSMSDYQSNDT